MEGKLFEFCDSILFNFIQLNLITLKLITADIFDYFGLLNVCTTIERRECIIKNNEKRHQNKICSITYLQQIRKYTKKYIKK